MAFPSPNLIAAISTFLCLSFMLSSSSAQKFGTASFTKPPYSPSACFEEKDQGVMIAGASDKIFNGGKNCGEIFQVTCIGSTQKNSPSPCRGDGKVFVKIVDSCPADSCGSIDLNLSQEAFSFIADPDAGLIKITFEKV